MSRAHFLRGKPGEASLGSFGEDQELRVSLSPSVTWPRGEEPNSRPKRQLWWWGGGGQQLGLPAPTEVRHLSSLALNGGSGMPEAVS